MATAALTMGLARTSLDLAPQKPLNTEIRLPARGIVGEVLTIENDIGYFNYFNDGQDWHEMGRIEKHLYREGSDK